MTHSSPTFVLRLRAALGLGTAGIPHAGTRRTPGPQGDTRSRGQVFADRLRRALDD